MPRSRSINSYPQSFWDIVEQAATGKQIFEFTFPTRVEALRFQGKFYGFRGALAREGLKLGQLLPADNPQRLKAEIAARQIQEIVCYVDPAEPIARIMHRDETPEAKMFEAALERSGKTRDQQLSESAQRLVDSLKQTGGKYG